MIKKIAKAIYDIPPVVNFKTPKKCKTCAYHVKSTEDEDYMTVCYFNEHPLPHNCHERCNGMACLGSMEKLEELKLWTRPL